MPRLEPGPELDRMLCEATGIAEPICECGDLHSRHIDGFCIEYPCMCEKFLLASHAIVPLSSTGDGMLILMATLELRGWLCTSETALADYSATCLRREAWGKSCYAKGDIFQAHHSTRAGAFALAAGMALGLSLDGPDSVALAMTAAAGREIREE